MSDTNMSKVDGADVPKAGASKTWATKYGPRRVRHDPPTLAEAIAAAQGLTDDAQAQVRIAAELMGAPVAEVKAEMQRLTPDRRATRLVSAPARTGTRTVVVERKVSRRVVMPAMAARPVGKISLAKS